MFIKSKINKDFKNVADYIKRDEIALVINTPLGQTSHFDEQAIRQAALRHNVPCVTTITGAEALVGAIATIKSQEKISVISLQEIHRREATVGK